MEDILKEQQLTFQLKGIELMDVKLNHPKEPLPAQTTFNFKINLEHKVSFENKLIIVVVMVDIIHQDNEMRLASLQAGCIFEISNFADFIVKDTQFVNIPDDLMVTLNSVSISTIRGIMFSQFRGTFLHTAILPVVDPKAFVKSTV